MNLLTILLNSLSRMTHIAIWLAILLRRSTSQQIRQHGHVGDKGNLAIRISNITRLLGNIYDTVTSFDDLASDLGCNVTMALFQMACDLIGNGTKSTCFAKDDTVLRLMFKHGLKMIHPKDY